MIMCCKCNRRPAVVFITSMKGNEKKNEGYCLTCAKASNIPQVAEYMEKLGISDEEMEQISEQMTNLLDGDAFEMGGSGLMPDFMSKMFGGMGGMDDFQEVESISDDNSKSDRKLFGKGKNDKKDKKDKKKKELRFLGSYCTNLSQKAADGKLDNIIGRDEEIARVIQILSRRTIKIVSIFI